MSFTILQYYSIILIFKLLTHYMKMAKKIAKLKGNKFAVNRFIGQYNKN